MTLQSIENSLNQEYTKDQLKAIYEALHSLAKASKAQMLALGASKEYIANLNKHVKGNASKSTYTKRVAPLFLFPDFFLALLAYMGPSGILDVFSALLVKKQLSVKDVNKIYGANLISKFENEGSAHFKRLTPVWATYAIFFFDTHQQYSWYSNTEEKILNNLYISLNDGKRALFRSVLPRLEAFTAKPISEKEVAKLGGEYFSAQESIFQELQKLDEAWDSGMVKLTKKGISESSVKKMQKTFDIKEFYTNEAININKFLFPMRTRLLLQLLMANPSEARAEPVELLKNTLQVYLHGSPNASGSFDFKELPFLLGHVTGSDKLYDPSFNYLYPNEYISPSGKEYIELLKSLHNGEEWIKASSAINHLTYDQRFPDPVKRATAESLYYRESTDIYGTNKVFIITDDDYLELVQQPMFLSCLGVLGALGLADLQIEEPPYTDVGQGVSHFIGIKAYRLNALGRYVLGINHNYDLSSIEIDQAEVSISADDLMVLLDREDESKAKVLKFYAQEISPRRFLVNSEAFLKNCKSAVELQDRIESFKKVINQTKLPPNWRNFFNSLKQRVLSLTPIEDMVIYQLPLDNKPLLQLIASNSEFRKIAEKAEGMRLLIEQKNIRKFKNLLKSHGYLVE